MTWIDTRFSQIPKTLSGMWGFLQDAEGACLRDDGWMQVIEVRCFVKWLFVPVSLDSINRGLMLPLSRESWVLKEAGKGARKPHATQTQLEFLHENVAGTLHHWQPCKKWRLGKKCSSCTLHCWSLEGAEIGSHFVPLKIHFHQGQPWTMSRVLSSTVEAKLKVGAHNFTSSHR